MPPFASHVEVESYLALADVLRDKGRKHNTVKIKMKVPAEAVEVLPKWSKKDMSQYIAFIRRWESLDAEDVTYWAKRNAQLKQQADKATAVDDGLLDPDGDPNLSRFTRPNNVTYNGSGRTTEVDLGEGVVVKVPRDKDGQVEGADQFRNNNRFLPLKVLVIRKAIYEASRNGLNMPKKSWSAGNLPDDFEKRENITHDSILRNFTIAQTGLHQEI
ncbi:hypothetical protein VTO58DRAFT_102720 [Aureobasidium pullulans]|nr:hypothetical protein JADG_003563 [Aureobasidium pullulans]